MSVHFIGTIGPSSNGSESRIADGPVIDRVYLVGSLRLLEAAAGCKVRDKRLWTEIAALTGAQGNSTALVGTGDQVADALLEYYDLGIRNFLIRGFDPFEDVLDYGHNLIPLVREGAAGRDCSRIAAE